MSHKIQTAHFINGEFYQNPQAQTFNLHDPSTEAHVATIPIATTEDIDLAVKHAKEGQKVWGAMTPAERSVIMRKFGQLVLQNTEKIAWLETQSMGRPSTQYALDTFMVNRYFEFYAALGETVHGDSSLNSKDHINFTLRQPYGVTAGILPFNYPIQMWASKAAGAVAAGNAIILKASEKTPLTALFLSGLTVDAGFPPGVIQSVSGLGPTGKAIAEHMEIRAISFTGSTRTGRFIAAAAAQSNLKSVTLELGGKSPAIIFDDAKLDQAVEETTRSILFNSGQTCVANSRIYVQEGVSAKVLEKLKVAFAAYKQGDPTKAETALGPQADKIQHQNVLAYLESGKTEGGKVAIGGNRFGDKGAFIEPTIFTDVQEGARINKEEIFGPVTIVHNFKDEEEVIRRANDTEYGLYASVYTQDIDRAMRVAKALESGTVAINSTLDFSLDVPFGGWKQSGIGHNNGLDGLDEWLETKSVILKYKSAI